MTSSHELLRNTDVVITVGPVPSDLAGCLPSSTIPLELSLGNRPILWHCLYPLLDAGAQNFFIGVAPDWKSSVKESLEQLTATFRLPRERFVYTLVVLDDSSGGDELKTANPVMQVVEYARHHRPADSMRDFLVVNYDVILTEAAIRTFLQGFQSNFASASVLFLERGARDIETDFICVDDTTVSSQSPAPAAGTVCFAEHRRLHLSEPMPCDPEHELKSNMLMRRPQIVFSKKFCQLPVYLFRPWVAHVLVAHYDRARPASKQQQSSSTGGGAAAGSSSAGAAATTSSSSTNGSGIEGNHGDASVETTPVRERRGGGAGAGGGNSDVNNDSSASAGEMGKSAAAAVAEASNTGRGADSPSSGKNNNNNITSGSSGNKKEDEAPETQLHTKFREDFLPSLLLCQFSSFIPTHEHHVHHHHSASGDAAAAAVVDKKKKKRKNEAEHDQLMFRALTSAQRLREELNLPSSFKSVPVHWCLEQPLTAAKMLRAHQQQLEERNAQQPQQQLLLQGGGGNSGGSSSNYLDISQADITLDVLNAMTASLASPHDAVRVFATLCKRNTYSDDVAAATGGSGTNAPVVPLSPAAIAEALCVPDIRRINSASAYDAFSQSLREGLALPPPPFFSALQKFAVPDLHAGTLQLLLAARKDAGAAAATAADEAPANVQRCGLLTLPPPGCRVERCIIGRDVKFGEKCNLFDSVVMDGADIGAGATLRRCVVGPRCSVKPEARYESLVLSWAGQENISTK